jgi:hypothetical protein
MRAQKAPSQRFEQPIPHEQTMTVIVALDRGAAYAEMKMPRSVILFSWISRGSDALFICPSFNERNSQWTFSLLASAP